MTTVLSSPAEAWRDTARAARTDLLHVLPSIGPFGVALGMTAAHLHQSAASTVLGAGLLYAGSAQLTVMTMLANGAGALAVLLAGIMVNARLLLYGAALERQFRAPSWWFRLVGAHFIIDATFLGATARPRDESPEGFRRYWWVLGGGVLAVWTASVATGVLIGPKLPPLPHLALVGLALFVVMLAPRLTNRPAVVAAGAAGIAAFIGNVAVPALAVPLGAAAGVLAGTFATRGKDRIS